MNIDLLNKVKAAILAEPEHFDMSWWVQETTCGTAGCIAGWAIALGQSKSFAQLESAYRSASADENFSYGFAGRQVLDLDPSQAFRLFGVEHWPDQFRDLYHKSKSKRWAQIAADRIDHFVATEGKE